MSMTNFEFCNTVIEIRKSDTNRYSFFANLQVTATGDPVNNSDPSGMITCPSWVPGCGTVTNVQNAVSGTVKKAINWTLERLKSVALDQAAQEIQRVKQVVTRLEGLSSCSTSSILPTTDINYLASVVSKLRLPDYITVDGSIAAYGGTVGIAVAIDRYGALFITPEAGLSVEGEALQVRVGWIDQSQKPSRDYLNSFLNGNSITVSGIVNASMVTQAVTGSKIPAGLALAETWGNVGDLGSHNFATEIGLAAASGHSLAATFSYSYHVADTSVTW